MIFFTLPLGCPSEGGYYEIYFPFVFAVWVSTKPLPDDFIQFFNEANKLGLQHIDEIIAANPFDLYDLTKYYKLHLSYIVDAKKRKSMAYFQKLTN